MLARWSAGTPRASRWPAPQTASEPRLVGRRRCAGRARPPAGSMPRSPSEIARWPRPGTRPRCPVQVAAQGANHRPQLPGERTRRPGAVVLSGERTRLACGFRRPAENSVLTPSNPLTSVWTPVPPARPRRPNRRRMRSPGKRHVRPWPEVRQPGKAFPRGASDSSQSVRSHRAYKAQSVA